MRALLLAAMLAGCTSVYVQTGDGTIERSTDIERSVRGRAATTVEVVPVPVPTITVPVPVPVQPKEEKR
jgi:hypothetical protein